MTGSGSDVLLDRISKAAASSDIVIDVLIPYDKGKLVDIAHRYCRLLSEENTENGTRLQIAVPEDLMPKFEAYRI